MYGTRRIILIVLALIAAFLLFMMVSFYLYPVFNPDAEIESTRIEMPRPSKGYYEFDYVRFGPAAVMSLQEEIEQLEEQIASRQDKDDRDIQVIDSLQRETDRKDRRIARLEAQLQNGQQDNADRFAFGGGFGGGTSASNGLEGDGRLAAIAKSLMTLDEEELGPIVNRLTDSQLEELYTNSSNIRRSKLMRSLDPGKAATLLRRVMK
ncbi:MAG: hypothetical protein ACQETE_03550 [Bacteroidota bacterium]